MSEFFKMCGNCIHYDRNVFFCKKKERYITKSNVCDKWRGSVAELFEGEPKPIDDPVNHPSHYTDGKIEVIDFIEDKKLNFNLGNVIKYVSRAGKKDTSKTIQDLKKAQWYLNREISTLEKDV